jgi:hypothetical protein
MSDITDFVPGFGLPNVMGLGLISKKLSPVSEAALGSSKYVYLLKISLVLTFYM